MACHEIAALRLGLMKVLGHDDEAERQHELAELGDGAARPGPLQAMCGATDLAALRRCYEAALAALEERVAAVPGDDGKLPYLRTLVVLTRKVELDLRHQIDGLTDLYRDLETMHDFVHEIYPAPPDPDDADDPDDPDDPDDRNDRNDRNDQNDRNDRSDRSDRSDRTAPPASAARTGGGA